MSCEDIIRALRCISTPGGPTGDCADRIERLEAENKALRAKLLENEI
jgi:hypothetical protein